MSFIMPSFPVDGIPGSGAYGLDLRMDSEVYYAKKKGDKYVVQMLMNRLATWESGMHIKCNEDGLITNVSIALDESSDAWYDSVEDLDITGFLACLEYVNDKGENDFFIENDFVEEEFLQCVKYFMRDEVNRRADLMHISRDEYLQAMLSGNVSSHLKKLVTDKSDFNLDFDYDNSLSAEVEWDDIARAATPDFRKRHIVMVRDQIIGIREVLEEECSEYEVAALNIEKLKELDSALEAAAPEEIVPDHALQTCYEIVREYGTEFSYYDLLDKDAFYDNLVAECQQYTYTLPEVATVIFKDSETDSYTIDHDKETLHEIVEAHPTQISKDGVPYSAEEIDTLVELASSIGWEAAGSGLGEVLIK